MGMITELLAVLRVERIFGGVHGAILGCDDSAALARHHHLRVQAYAALPSENLALAARMNRKRSAVAHVAESNRLTLPRHFVQVVAAKAGLFAASRLVHVVLRNSLLPCDQLAGAKVRVEVCLLKRARRVNTLRVQKLHGASLLQVHFCREGPEGAW